MITTARFALPLIAPGQAQKEVYHNEALAAIDAALHACVTEAPRADPPAEPDEGESWIVAADATGAWEGAGRFARHLDRGRLALHQRPFPA